MAASSRLHISDGCVLCAPDRWRRHDRPGTASVRSPPGGRSTNDRSSTSCCSSFQSPTSPGTTPTCGGTPSCSRRSSRTAASRWSRRRPRLAGGARTLDVPSPRGTLTLYIHYDGQPVDADRVDALQAVRAVPLRRDRAGDGRRRGEDLRSASGASTGGRRPTTRARSWRCSTPSTRSRHRQQPAWNLRVVLDGEEEAGSANFRRFATARADELKADLAITLDGPRHPSGRPTLYYGVRGGAGVTVTVFGAKNDLHSGNYGNWAPDPSMRLARLLASMKDDTGRVTIDGFYDDVTPLTPTEQRALDEAPNVEAELKKDFRVALPERAEERLERKLNEPTLSMLAMESGGGFDAPRALGDSGVAPQRASRCASCTGSNPQKQNGLVVAHIRQQGYFVVEGRDPTEEERLTHQLIARVDRRGGSTAPRVSMDDPMAKAVGERAVKHGTRARAAADARRQHAVRHFQRPDADRRHVDRQSRQQPARAGREPAAAESMGRNRDAGGDHDDGEVSGVSRPRRARSAD